MSGRVSSRAVKLYQDFHQFEPRKVGEFPPSFKIPKEARFAGAAEHVLYRSDKLNPSDGRDEGVIDYIHEHEGGVVLCRTDARCKGPLVRLPKWIWSVQSLTRLGDSLGFAWRDDEDEVVEAGATKPLPELYSTPNGRALLVIQGKRTVAAVVWGGKLGVEPRGIVG